MWSKQTQKHMVLASPTQTAAALGYTGTASKLCFEGLGQTQRGKKSATRSIPLTSLKQCLPTPWPPRVPPPSPLHPLQGTLRESNADSKRTHLKLLRELCVVPGYWASTERAAVGSERRIKMVSKKRNQRGTEASPLRDALQVIKMLLALGSNITGSRS